MRISDSDTSCDTSSYSDTSESESEVEESKVIDIRLAHLLVRRKVMMLQMILRWDKVRKDLRRVKF